MSIRHARHPTAWTWLIAASLALLSADAQATPQATPHAPRCSRTKPVELQRALRLAIVQDEPGSCSPLCRKGYLCQKGKCISQCNPPCPAGQRCVEGGECELMPRPGEPTRRRYFALLGGARLGVNDSAASYGELRAEIGSRWISFQIGGGFGPDATSIRGALVGHVAYQPIATVPFYLQPRLALGYSYNWVDDLAKTRQQQFFVTPGLRLRYDVLRKMAIFLDAIQLEINYLRLQSNDTDDTFRSSAAPIHWGLHAGVAFVY